MYEVTVFLWFLLPYLLMIIAASLMLMNVYLFTQGGQYQRGRRGGFRRGLTVGEKRGHARGLAAGRTEGEAAGRESEYLEHQNFVQCPECDHAIHVPCHIVIDGEPGAQEIRAEVDQTELVLHMYQHTGQLPPQSPDAPHEGSHQ